MVEKVMFRVSNRTGEVFGLYPEVPANHWDRCKSTRGPVNVKESLRESRAASDAEAAPLASTLGRIRIVHRETPAMRRLRFDCLSVGELR